ncbi:MAG: hypothetical protein LBR21_04175 [Propionibacteriaceae bacterium]|jgi:hypothetical protein|nr:hypothetical protein [Propionibacteriaceae bacterium]
MREEQFEELLRTSLRELDTPLPERGPTMEIVERKGRFRRNASLAGALALTVALAASVPWAVHEVSGAMEDAVMVNVPKGKPSELPSPTPSEEPLVERDIEDFRADPGYDVFVFETENGGRCLIQAEEWISTFDEVGYTPRAAGTYPNDGVLSFWCSSLDDEHGDRTMRSERVDEEWVSGRSSDDGESEYPQAKYYTAAPGELPKLASNEFVRLGDATFRYLDPQLELDYLAAERPYTEDPGWIETYNKVDEECFGPYQVDDDAPGGRVAVDGYEECAQKIWDPFNKDYTERTGNEVPVREWESDGNSYWILELDE